MQRPARGDDEEEEAGGEDEVNAPMVRPPSVGLRASRASVGKALMGGLGRLCGPPAPKKEAMER